MTSESMRRARALMGATMLAALLALGACGGGGSGSDSADAPVLVAPPPAASSPVGPGQTATVTITGPNGAAVAVPAGAASAPVTIVVAQAAAASAPSLPASTAAASAIYEITPHGQAFDKAVDVAIPFDATRIAAGERPILLKAEPGGEWAAITDVRVDGGMLHALVADFSYFAVASCGSYAVTTCATTPALSLKVAAPSISSAASAVLASPPAGSAFDLVAVVERFAPVQIEVQLTVPAVCLSARSKLGIVLSSNIDTNAVGIQREPTKAGKTLTSVMTLTYTGADEDFVVRRTRVVGAALVADLTAFYTYTPSVTDDVVFAASASCRASPALNLSSSPIRFVSDIPSIQAGFRLPFGVAEAPTDQTVAPGQTAIFYVTAALNTDVPTNYQWERSDDAGATWVSIVGAQKPRYELVNARLDDNGARFRAVLLGYDVSVSQSAVVSDAATLTVSSSTLPVVDPVASEAPWQADSVIAAGGSAAFVVHFDKTLTSWGTNNGGVLGRASGADGSPQPIDLADVRSVVSGAWYAAALVGNGDVYAWGWGGNVGTAIGSTSLDNPLPQKVTGLANIRAIATRYQHTLALDVNGDVYGFGPEAPGGLGPMIGNDGVRKIAGIDNVRQVAAGDTHSLALRSDGTVWAWGGNGSGQLGVPTAGAVQSAPVLVPGLSDVVGIAASSYASFALRRDGTVWSWGQAFMLGRTGDPGTPMQVASLSLVSAIAAGNYNAFAIQSTGQPYGWGDNAAGRVGVGSTASTVDVPTVITGLGFTRQITGGEVTGLAVASTGGIVAWGSNAYGGLGGPVNGVPRTDSNAPVDTDVER